MRALHRPRRAVRALIERLLGGAHHRGRSSSLYLRGAAAAAARRSASCGWSAARGVLALLGRAGAPAPDGARERPAGVAGYLRECLDHVMSVALLRENYFWSVYMSGRYARESCPEYLKPEKFARLKAGLVGRRDRACTGTVTDCLARGPEPFTAFVLLDHMDWLVRAPALLADEWERIFAAARPGSAGDIQERRARRARSCRGGARGGCVFEPERAERLHRRDRVGTYGSFHIARCRSPDRPTALRPRALSTASTASRRRIYDWTRPFLLFGRRARGRARRAPGRPRARRGLRDRLQPARSSRRRARAWSGSSRAGRCGARGGAARVSGARRAGRLDARPYGTHDDYAGARGRACSSRTR